MKEVINIPLKRITIPEDRIRIKNLDKKNIGELAASIQKVDPRK